MKQKGYKTICFLIIILIIAVTGLAYYCISLNQKINNNNSNEVKEESSKDERKSETEKLTLFNDEKTLKQVCTNSTGICNETLGEFSLGEKKYSFQIHYNMDDLDNVDFISNVKNNDDLANYVIFDDKKIYISDEIPMILDKIVKIDDKYIALGLSGSSGNVYQIDIYDEDLNLVRNYNSFYDTNIDYFNVIDNTFSRYECDITGADSEGNGQILKRYQVTINGNKFEEKLMSSVSTFCSAQT